MCIFCFRVLESFDNYGLDEIETVSIQEISFANRGGLLTPIGKSTAISKLVQAAYYQKKGSHNDIHTI